MFPVSRVQFDTDLSAFLERAQAFRFPDSTTAMKQSKTVLDIPVGPRPEGSVDPGISEPLSTSDSGASFRSLVI